MKLKFILSIFLVIIIFVVSFIPYEEFEVPIYDGIEGNVYNLGDKLNIASYSSASWPPTKISDFFIEEKEINTIYKYSVYYYFYHLVDENEYVPNMPRTIYAVDEYIKNHNTFQDLIDTVSNPKTLTVHIRTGDKGVIEDSYVEMVKNISDQYDDIFILSGVHAETRGGVSIEDAKKNLNLSLEKLQENNKNVIVNLDKQDVHLSLMRKSSNLVLHKGGFSGLGGILFQGDNLYISPMFEPKNNPDYIDNLNKNINIVFL